MGRRIITGSVAVALSYILALAGNEIIVSFLNAPGRDDKQVYLSALAVEVFVLFPAIAALVGLLIGVVDRDGGWWFAGLALTPLMLYILFQSGLGILAAFCIVYEALAMTTAYVVLRMRKALNG